MKNLFILILLGLITALTANAQITLKLYEKLTTQPIQGAQVEYSWNDKRTGQKNMRVAISSNKGFCEVEDAAIQAQGEFTITHPSLGAPQHINAEELQKKHYTLYLTNNTHALDEAVVSANRTEERARDVSRQIDLIKRQQITFANQQNTADLLFNQSNVYLQKSQQGGGSPVIRGFEANRVLIVVDGIRLNNAIFRAGHLQNVLRIDQNVLQKAEVMYGNGSVIYGSDALGGVVNLVTRKPEFNTTPRTLLIKNELYTRFSNANNEVTHHYNVMLGLKKWASFTGITYSNFGNVISGRNRSAEWEQVGLRPTFVKRINGVDQLVTNPNKYEQVESNYRQLDLIQKLSFSPNQANRNNINIQYSNTSNVPRYDRLTDADNSGNLKSAAWYYGPEKRLLAAYTWEHVKAHRAFDILKITPAYQRIQESRNDRAFQSVWLRTRMEDLDVFSLNVDAYKQIGRHELRYGIDGQHNLVYSKAYQKDVNTGVEKSLSTRYPAGGSSLSSAALFFSHTWEFNNHFVLNEGVRLSYLTNHANFGVSKDFYSFLPASTSQQNTALNGNIGLVYSDNHRNRFFLNLSNGFRAPNIDDLNKLFDSQKNNVIIPNEQLKPEQTATLEIGTNLFPAKGLQLNANVFYTQLYDAIVVSPTQVNGSDSITYDGSKARVNSLSNAQKAFVYGYQLTTNYTLGVLNLYGAYTYTYGRVTSTPVETPLDHIPPVYGRFGGAVKLKGWMLDAYTQFSGAKKLSDYSQSGEDNLQYATSKGMPAWYTLNIRGQYSLYTRGVLITLQSGIENIADVHYRLFASGISAPGRNIYAALRLNF